MAPQTVPPPAAPVYILVQPQGRADNKEHFAKTFPAKVIHWLCLTQIVLFVVCLVTEVRP